MTETFHASPLSNLIDRQLHAAGALEGLLMAEYSALLSSDLAALTDLVAQKRSTAESLEHSSVALSEFTGGAPEKAVLQAGAVAIEKWQRLGAIANRLRRQNLANGALLNERQNRLRWVAERASGGAQTLYGPGTSTGLASALSGRSLARI
ncbi:MAG: flagellar protein FlgN [Stagnimonas sp.]|nr:flagellar protein FlgN [Stagnimonas sp.]